MPRLGSFLICEKIIQDTNGPPTLVSVFQQLKTLVAEGQEMVAGTMAGTTWAVFCEWFFTSDEATAKSFDHVLEVILPDGSPSGLRGRLPLQEISKEGLGTRAYFNLFGMPVAQAGFVTVNVWLESGSERVTDIFSYRLRIEHTTHPPTPDEGGSIAPTLTLHPAP